MTHRERMVNTLTFKPVDRLPLVEWGLREATMNAFCEQGYPRGVHMRDYFGLDPFRTRIEISFDMMPKFKEEIIERDENYKIWRDELGAIRKDFLRNAEPGFVTRSWLSFPVSDRAGFLEIKKRFNPDTPGRAAADFAQKIPELNNSKIATLLTIPYLFWTIRDWMGFENLCVAFYDMPELIDEMFEFWTDFVIAVIDKNIGELKPDIVELKEDMAYKHAPMISPEMFDRFMRPHYIRLISYLRAHGAKIVFVDCDGFPGGLIDRWIDCGVDCMSPTEIAAGCDPVEIRKQYPRFSFMGGIDKRVLSTDKKRVYAEVMSKVPYLADTGGYVPHIDHSIPADAKLSLYSYYVEIMKKVIRGQAVEPPND